MRPVISWSSYSRGATISASTGWDADYPAANVLDLAKPTKVARGGTSLTVDLGGSVPVSFVGIEAVFVMNHRRHALWEDPLRHHPVDRAPIIGQHKVEPAHIAGDRLIAGN